MSLPIPRSCWFWIAVLPFGFLCLLIAPGVRAEQTKELDTLFDMNLDELMELEVVTATKTFRQFRNVPATVRVVTKQQIRERGFLTIDEALADLPGLQFRNLLGLNSYVFIRGLPSQNNLILLLVDGIQINELNSGGFYGGGHYNLANVERIEVVYGPASALYGTNAVSGIINVITKDYEQEQGLVISGLCGSFNTAWTDLQYAFFDKKRQFGFRVSGMFKTTTKADLVGAKGDYNWTADMENVEDDYSLDMKLTWRDFTIGTNYQNRRAAVPTYFPSMGTTYLDRGTLWNLRFLNIYLKHATSLLSNLSLHSKLYYRDTTVIDDSVQQVTEAGQVGYYRPNHLAGAELQINYAALASLVITGGLVYEYEWLAESYANTQSDSPDVRPARPSAPDFVQNKLLSAYLQADYELLSMLQFTAGLRFDHSSAYAQVMTPRAALVFYQDDLTAKLLFAEAFRAPRPWDYTNGLGNRSLDPERMRSLEISISYLWQNAFHVTLAMYANRLESLLAKETIGEDWRWRNLGHIWTYGAELSGQLEIGSFRLYCNYSYTLSLDENDDQVPEIGRHGFNAGLRYVLLDNVVFNLVGNYLGSRPNATTDAISLIEEIDGAFVLQGSFSLIGFSGFDIQLISRNILDAKYFHSSNRQVSRYRQPQQTVYVKTTYRF